MHISRWKASAVLLIILGFIVTLASYLDYFRESGPNSWLTNTIKACNAHAGTPLRPTVNNGNDLKLKLELEQMKLTLKLEQMKLMIGCKVIAYHEAEYVTARNILLVGLAMTLFLGSFAIYACLYFTAILPLVHPWVGMPAKFKLGEETQASPRSPSPRSTYVPHTFITQHLKQMVAKVSSLIIFLIFL